MNKKSILYIPTLSLLLLLYISLSNCTALLDFRGSPHEDPGYHGAWTGDGINLTVLFNEPGSLTGYGNHNAQQWDKLTFSGELTGAGYIRSGTVTLWFFESSTEALTLPLKLSRPTPTSTLTIDLTPVGIYTLQKQL